MLKKLISYFANNDFYNDCGAENNCDVINGQFKVSNKEIATPITVNGEAVIEAGSVFKNRVQVNGSLQASQSCFESLLVANGTINLHDIRLETAELSGGISINNTECREQLSIRSAKAEFNHCTLNSINIKAILKAKIQQSVFLMNQTVVKGNITCEGGSAIIYIDNTSAIQGEVIGAEIKQLNPNPETN
ncbi:hypothetical protein ACFORL_08030 [Legionella dresdenensis]|uniref:Polymer-forming cytoskeletal n=1 Tax=Legionella dresdenensis TaxID=450200 RepID=A0ABV8CG80_9GAMM